MLNVRKNGDTWELVESDDDSAGSPQKVLKRYTGICAGARATIAYWGLVLASFFARPRR